MKNSGMTCPDGWELNQFVDEYGESQKKCYKFVTNGRDFLPWYDSVKYCQSIGARFLVIIQGSKIFGQIKTIQCKSLAPRPMSHQSGALSTISIVCKRE
jgi:hypothetical protein